MPRQIGCCCVGGYDLDAVEAAAAESGPGRRDGGVLSSGLFIDLSGSQMTKAVRRVVTGHHADGRSTVVLDGAAPNVKQRQAGNGSTLLWVTDETPAQVSGSADRAAREDRRAAAAPRARFSRLRSSRPASAAKCATTRPLLRDFGIGPDVKRGHPPRHPAHPPHAQSRLRGRSGRRDRPAARRRRRAPESRRRDRAAGDEPCLDQPRHGDAAGSRWCSSTRKSHEHPLRPHRRRHPALALAGAASGGGARAGSRSWFTSSSISRCCASATRRCPGCWKTPCARATAASTSPFPCKQAVMPLLHEPVGRGARDRRGEHGGHRRREADRPQHRRFRLGLGLQARAARGRPVARGAARRWRCGRCGGLRGTGAGRAGAVDPGCGSVRPLRWPPALARNSRARESFRDRTWKAAMKSASGLIHCTPTGMAGIPACRSTRNSASLLAVGFGDRLRTAGNGAAQGGSTRRLRDRRWRAHERRPGDSRFQAVHRPRRGPGAHGRAFP